MPRYRITVAAGMGWPGPRGLVRPGEDILVSDSFTPSIRCMEPLDEAAHAQLVKAKATYVEGLEERLGELDPPQKLNAKKKKELLHVPPLEVVEAEQPVDVVDEPEDEGETLKEVGEKHEAHVTGKLEKGKNGGKRLADS